MRGSSRLDGVPEYLSTRLMRTVAEARARGVDVISLGIGDPDTPPPLDLREEIGAQALRDDLHVYPTEPRHRAAARGRRRALPHAASASSSIPRREILPLLGAKEGLAHLCLAQLDPGDVALVADPGYPVYYGGPALAGGEAIGLPLRAENGFLPDLDAHRRGRQPAREPAHLRLPEQPDGRGRRRRASSSAWRPGGRSAACAICHDNAYAELTYDGIVAPSFLAAPGAREAGIEIYSLSKSLSMPGWRIAFAVGNAELIGRLRTLKTNIDSGMWLAEQHAAIRAVERIPSFTAGLRELYGRRRDVLCDGLERLGLEHVRPRGALYVWVRVPGGGGSVAFAERLLEGAAVVVGPGAAYGPSSDGYVRLSLTVSGGAPRARRRAHRRACSEAGRRGRGAARPLPVRMLQTVGEDSKLIEYDARPERAVLVAVLAQGADEERELAEMRELLRTAQVDIVATLRAAPRERSTRAPTSAAASSRSSRSSPRSTRPRSS